MIMIEIPLWLYIVGSALLVLLALGFAFLLFKFIRFYKIIKDYEEHL